MNKHTDILGSQALQRKQLLKSVAHTHEGPPSLAYLPLTS